MDSPYSESEQEESEEYIDFIRFRSLVPDVKVKLPEEPFHEPVDKSTNKSFFSQLTCSSKYGYFVAACQTGFVFSQTKHMYDSIYATQKSHTASLEERFLIPVKEGGVKYLVLSQDELTLIVGVSHGLLLIYHVADIIKSRENALPVRTITLDGEITGVYPNPEVYPDLVAVCLLNAECKLVQTSTGKITQTIPNTIMASWSPRGKQIACGNEEGSINTVDVTGNIVDTILAPPDIESTEVRALLWLENHIFLVVYGNTESPDSEHSTFIINRKASSEEEKYQLLDEITPIYNDDNCDNQFYMSVIRNYGPEAKTMVIVANAIANDLAVIGQHENGTYKTWAFEEGFIPLLPLSDDGCTDTFPVGIAVDFSSSKDLPPFDASESDDPVPPMPIFLLLTNEGRICAYHIYNTNLAKAGERYSGMVNAQDVFSIPSPSIQLPGASVQPPASVQPLDVSSPFGAALNAPAFGAPTNAKIPSFSDMLANASSAPKPNTSAFGSVQTSTPVFGSVGFGGAGMTQTSSFAHLAKTATQISPSSAFGSQPTFNSTTSFGSLQKSSHVPQQMNAPSTPAFGSTTSFGNLSKNVFAESNAPNANVLGSTHEEPKQPIEEDQSNKEESSEDSFVFVDNPSSATLPPVENISERLPGKLPEQVIVEEKHEKPTLPEPGIGQVAESPKKESSSTPTIENTKEKPNTDKPSGTTTAHSELDSWPSLLPRFSTLPKTTKESKSTAQDLTATHPVAKAFESIYFETKECIENTSSVLTNIQQELDFHQSASSSLKSEEHLESMEQEWKRGDTYSIGLILDKLNARMPIAKEEIKALHASLKKLEPSVDQLVDYAECLNMMEIQKTDDVKRMFTEQDLEEIKEMSVDIQYKELLKIMEAKKDSFEKVISTSEKRINELEEQLDIASVPSRPQQKLTTYTLRRTIRDSASSIRSAESKIESLEKAFQEKLQKSIPSNDSISVGEDEDDKKIQDAIAEKYINERLHRQVLFTNLFSCVHGRVPLSTALS